MDEADRLLRRIRRFAKICGKELPTDAELEKWAQNACVEHDYQIPKEKGENVYRARLLPQSEEGKERYGEAVLSLCEWEAPNGKVHFGFATFYHGTRTLVELGYEDKNGFEKDCIVKEVKTPHETKTMKYYPVMSTKGHIVRELEAQGVLEFEEGNGDFNGSPMAVLTLPDKVFCNLTHECFTKYVSMRVAAMLNVSMTIGPACYFEELEKRLGEKEYRVLKEHYHMLCDNAVKAVHVIEESKGIAMVDNRLLGAEEREFVLDTFDRCGLDMERDVRFGFITPISNVIKKNLLDERLGAYYAKTMAKFLNKHGPMRRAREKNEIREFEPKVLRAMTFTAAEAQTAKQAIRDAETEDENGDEEK